MNSAGLEPTLSDLPSDVLPITPTIHEGDASPLPDIGGVLLQSPYIHPKPSAN